ncbi:MAG: sterol desaturase/sphingolipid hydroxylase (fatty acid hydroxylase superfamily) [Planctomycetota bacterium]
MGHWASHRVTFLWHFHRVHHSSKELDIWNANRFHCVEFLWGGYVGYFTMALIGFPAEEVVAVAFLLAVTNVYSHANVNIPLGPLKYIFNNPQLHIWHHAASVDPRRNVNYGSSLAVWDYLLGTAYRPEGRPTPELGYHGDEDFPSGLWAQFLDPFVAIGRDIRGWSPRRKASPPAPPNAIT